MLTAGSDMWMLSAEAGTVMALRTVRIAAGGAAEAELMVTKEVRAAIELQTCLMPATRRTSAMMRTASSAPGRASSRSCTSVELENLQ